MNELFKNTLLQHVSSLKISGKRKAELISMLKLQELNINSTEIPENSEKDICCDDLSIRSWQHLTSI